MAIEHSFLNGLMKNRKMKMTKAKKAKILISAILKAKIILPFRREVGNKLLGILLNIETISSFRWLASRLRVYSRSVSIVGLGI